MKKNLCVFLSVVAFSILNSDSAKAEIATGKGLSATKSVAKSTRSSSASNAKNTLHKKSTDQILSQENNEENPSSLSDEPKSKSTPLSEQSSSLEELMSLQKSINKAIENAKKEYENTQRELANAREKLADIEGELVSTKEKHTNTQKELDQSNEKLKAAKMVVIDHINEIKTKKKEIAEHKGKLSEKDEEIRSHKKDLEAKNQEVSSEKDRHGETARQLSQKILELAEEQKAHEQQVSENSKVREELDGLRGTIADLKNHYSQSLQESENINKRKMDEALIILGRNLSAARKRIEKMRNNPNFPKEFESDIKRLEELMSELRDDIKLLGTDIPPESSDSSAAELVEQE
ncbi:MAG: hypothetical protein LBJ71_03045 [Holosporaceae bacterium]|jgi:chromosome segregation ATPase|nr:hypothetical protein [Holosporaceae bacterium]